MTRANAQVQAGPAGFMAGVQRSGIDRCVMRVL